MPPEFLERITIKGFKSIASIEDFELRPINVLIGANGSGKSNFIGAFSLLRSFGDVTLANYARESGGAGRLLHFGPEVSPNITLRLSFRDQTSFEINLKPGIDNSLFVEEPSPFKYGSSEYAERNRPDWWHFEADTAGVLRDRLMGWQSFHFNDTGVLSPLRQTAKLDDNRFLRRYGSNLPAFLYYLRKRHPRSYESILATL